MCSAWETKSIRIGSIQGMNFIELLLIQTMEPGNKGYKTLAELLEREAKKVEES